MAASRGMAVWNTADSDDEAENSEDFLNKNRTADLCVIDVSPNMFRSCWGENEDTPFVAALKYCHSLWRGKIVSSPKDLVGILLCGSEQTKNSSDFPNLFVLHELSQVTVSSLTDLDRLKKSTDFSEFMDTIGSSPDYDVHNMFWLCKLLFDDAKTGSFGKHIIYFTCEDNPHSDSPDLQNQIVRKFKDLGNVHFQIVTFNEQFDHTKFYSNMLETENDVIRPENLASLLNVSRIRQRRQRPIYHSTLQVAPEFRVGVGLYSMARRTLPPKAVKINKRNNEPVTKIVSKFRADTGMPVLKSEQVSVVEVQGEKAVFTKDELSTSKYTSTTGLTLLAFLDQSKFDQFQWFRCNGYFLYPDEDKWPGSKEFLACLLRRCLALKKCVLVRVVLSRGKTPKLGCLMPTNGDGQKVPQGFYLFMIPFADEIRDLSALATNSEPSAELIELVEQVVKKTTQKQFDPLLIQNPVLQMKWREIETAVFNDEDIQIEGDDFQDFTEPNVDSMKNRIGEASSEIMRIAQLEGGSFSSALSKKPKVDINMEMEAKNRRVEKLTVDVLREFLINVQVKVVGKRKADLVASVYEYFKK